jgi:ubiquinone/menaquinone biosynthesis C-methylase UbiE
MPEQVRNPIFARLYTVMSRHESEKEQTFRRRLMDGVSGRVVEVGAGSGANFAHYPPAVTEVVAVEPEPYLRKQAGSAAVGAPVPVEVRAGTAEAIPAEDDEFDVAVVSLMLCTVPDQAAALSEVSRVLRPDGELRFYEHVISHKPGMARMQRIFDRTFWPHVAGGCHCARDTEAAIERAGFSVESCHREAFPAVPVLPPFPHIVGVARRR